VQLLSTVEGDCYGDEEKSQEETSEEEITVG
jgi:hypothetical protein